jgi:hypothetical protein
MSTKKAIISGVIHEEFVEVDQVILAYWRGLGYQGPPNGRATLVVAGVDWEDTTTRRDEEHWYAVTYDNRYKTYFKPPRMDPNTKELRVYRAGTVLNGTSEPGTGDSEAHGDATGTSDSGPYESLTPFNTTSAPSNIDFFLIVAQDRGAITVAPYVFGIREA